MLLACCRLSAPTDVGTSISFWMRCEIIKCICYIELSLIVQKQGRKTRIEWHAVFGCDWRGHFNFILNEVWNNKSNMLSWIIFNCIKMSRLFVERGIICLIVITGGLQFEWGVKYVCQSMIIDLYRCFFAQHIQVDEYCYDVLSHCM